MWQDFINDIVCVNLNHREDRLLDFAKQADEYGIPFRRYSAIHDEHGARGLMNTMINLFNESIDKKVNNLLVFEDDALFKVPPPLFNDYMDKVVDQLPENYHLCFLGCQITSNGCKFHSANLIRVIKCFSTHAVLWSLQGMKEVISRGFDFPIDNWLVDHIEPLGHSYCVYPLLASQKAGYSDINKNFIDWSPFIDQRFEQQVANIRR